MLSLSSFTLAGAQAPALFSKYGVASPRVMEKVMHLVAICIALEVRYQIRYANTRNQRKGSGTHVAPPGTRETWYRLVKAGVIT